MKKSLLLLISFLLFSFLTFAQQPTPERARLENERKSIQNELKQLQDQYAKLRGTTKATLGQLSALQHRMEVQERLLSNINRDVHILTDEIYLNTLEVNRLQRQLDTMKDQYTRSVIYAYKTRSSYDYLNFIFSSSSFNDALKRIRYLRTYRAYRQQQVAHIIDTQKLLEDKKKQLLVKRTEKNQALHNQTEQFNELEGQKKEKDMVVAKLKSQEKDMAKQIAARQKRDKQLKNQIATIVRREIENARKEEERRLAAEKAKANANTTTTGKSTGKATKVGKPESYLTLNAGQRELAASFERNKGSLPWPVDNGAITIPFGRSRIGQLDFDNPGITIGTPSAGTPVKAVFNGEVSAVSNTGDGMMVMVRHGKYFTVYSNLSSANVTKGQSVTTGQLIGHAAQADDGGGGQVDFMIMKEYDRVNPSSWLHR